MRVQIINCYAIIYQISPVTAVLAMVLVTARDPEKIANENLDFADRRHLQSPRKDNKGPVPSAHVGTVSFDVG